MLDKLSTDQTIAFIGGMVVGMTIYSLLFIILRFDDLLDVICSKICSF